MIEKDDNNATMADDVGFKTRKANRVFDVCIPLSHIFRFARDVNKNTYGLTHTIDQACQNGITRQCHIPVSYTHLTLPTKA